MQRLPIVVSTFTGLTCLSLRLVTLVYDLPPWLALLTGRLGGAAVWGAGRRLEPSLLTVVQPAAPKICRAVLRRLEYQVSVQNHYTRGLPDVLDALPSLQSLVGRGTRLRAMGTSSVGRLSPTTTSALRLQDWAGGVVRTVRQGAYLSRLTSLHSVPDAYAFTPLLRKDFLDISALTGKTHGQ